MATVYCNDGGSNTSPYDTMAKAATTFATAVGAASANDIILVGHDHTETLSASTAYIFPNGVKVYSVNTTTEAYQPSAVTTLDASGGNYQLTFSGGSNISISGIQVLAGNAVNFTTNYSGFIFRDCSIESSNAGGGAYLTFNGNGSKTVFYNCVIGQTATASIGLLQFITSYDAEFNNCTFSATQELFYRIITHSVRVVFNYCDMSGITTTGNLFESVGTTYRDIIFNRCTLPPSITGWNLIDGSDSKGRLSVNGYLPNLGGADDADTYYGYAYVDVTGEFSTNTTTYLNATYDGTNGFSTLIEPSANSSIGNPLRHKLCEIPAQDLTASVDVTVEFTCASTLTDTEFWLEVVHPDATDNALGVTVSTRNADILATGTTHTTSSETWTVGKTYKYKDTATIPALTGVTNGTLEVYVCLADPTAAKDVWVDPAVTIA